MACPHTAITTVPWMFVPRFRQVRCVSITEKGSGLTLLLWWQPQQFPKLDSLNSRACFPYSSRDEQSEVRAMASLFSSEASLSVGRWLLSGLELPAFLCVLSFGSQKGTNYSGAKPILVPPAHPLALITSWEAWSLTKPACSRWVETGLWASLEFRKGTQHSSTHNNPILSLLEIYRMEKAKKKIYA